MTSSQANPYVYGPPNPYAYGQPNQYAYGQPDQYAGMPASGPPPQTGMPDPLRYVPADYPISARHDSVSQHRPIAPGYGPPPPSTRRASEAANLAPPQHEHLRPRASSSTSHKRPHHSTRPSYSSRHSHETHHSHHDERHSHDHSRQSHDHTRRSHDDGYRDEDEDSRHHHHHHHKHTDEEDEPLKLKRRETPRPTLGDTMYALAHGVKSYFRG